MSGKTCGELYLSAVMQYTAGDPEKTRLFAAGHINGQAEKVYLGACRAAMFRPSTDAVLAMLLPIVEDCANRYGLMFRRFECSYGVELWLLRDASADRMALGVFATMVENSAMWHQKRGELFGVPVAEIDCRYHERQQFGKPCDHGVAEKGLPDR